RHTRFSRDWSSDVCSSDLQRKILSKMVDKDTTITLEGRDPLENTMVLNMGPQHPATHGVLRVLLRLDGETVEKCVPELGYLHREIGRASCRERVWSAVVMV